MDLVAWLAKNRAKLGSSYEELFVQSVLPLVPGLDPRALSAQFHFHDDRGGNRYCDFVIREGRDLRIAIEVDGYDKRGTGQGMSRADWLDWQRRQASLTSQGWNVIRFANADVRDHPERCAEHLGLLLQRERSKAQHSLQLQEQIAAMERRRALDERKVAEERAGYGNSAPGSSTRKLEQELTQFKAALEHAKRTPEPTAGEQARLAELEQAQREQQILRKDNTIMKTTIWAAVVLAVVLAFLLFQERARSGSDAVAGPTAKAYDSGHVPAPTEAAQEASLAGSSCTSPLSWQEAGNRMGETVALVGPVTRVVQRDDVRGKPVFITIGRPFPSADRLDVVIWRNHRAGFVDVLEEGLEGRDICVLAEIGQRDGIPQVVLQHRSELQVR